MNSTSERLQEIQKHGFTLDMEAVFKEAFYNYKKITLTIGTLLFVLILLTTILSAAAYFYFGFKSLTELPTNMDVSNFSTLEIIAQFAITTIVSALAVPFSAGFVRMAHNAATKQPFGISTAFSYYRSSYFKDLFTAALIIAVFTSGVNALLNLFTELNGIERLNPLLNLFIGVFNGLASLFTMFTIPLIIFGNLPAKEAIKGSITLVLKKFWPILGLALLGAFCAISFGLMAFCFGIFYTLPFMYSLQYTIYRNAMGIESEEKSF